MQPGLYVSRKDKVGAETVTTFDLRLTKPNDEPVMNTAEVHTIEHLAATYLRNEPTWKDKVLYFGPMGCRTGFYLLLTGDYTSKDVVPLCWTASASSGTTGERCRGQAQKTAATIWT